jgi:hypothetical protein
MLSEREASAFSQLAKTDSSPAAQNDVMTHSRPPSNDLNELREPNV